MTNREIMTEILFENLKIEAAYIGNPAVFSLYSSGRGSGVVLDSGEGIS